MHILVKFKGDYNDADYVYGFKVFTKDEWDSILEEVKAQFEEDENEGVHVYVNSESITWNTYEDWLSCYEIGELSNSQYLVMQELFASYSYIKYGNFQIP